MARLTLLGPVAPKLARVTFALSTAPRPRIEADTSAFAAARTVLAKVTLPANLLLRTRAVLSARKTVEAPRGLLGLVVATSVPALTFICEPPPRAEGPL